MEIKQRLTYFDQMKGLAIILVVIGHVIQFSFGLDSTDVVKMLGIFHMPIFFYVSGYMTYKELPNATEMLSRLYKRTLNVLLPYIVFGALWCKFSGASFSQFIFDGGGRYWFLWVLFLISFFFIIWGYLLQKVKKDWLYVMLWLIPYAVIMVCKVFENRWGGQIFGA